MGLKSIFAVSVAAATLLLSPAPASAGDEYASKSTTTTGSLLPEGSGKKTARNPQVIGVADALVTVAEYGDLQCPNSARAADVYYPRIVRDFLPSIRYEFRAFPHDFHPQAVIAEVAARCAGEQGKYLEFRNRLLADQGPVTPGSILGLAGELALNESDFRQCLVRGDHATEIRQQKTDGEQIGVRATPTYVIFTGTGVTERKALLKNPKTYDEIRDAIEHARRQSERLPAVEAVTGED